MLRTLVQRFLWAPEPPLEDNLAAARRAKAMAEQAGDAAHVAFLRGEIARIQMEILLREQLQREAAAGFARERLGHW